MKRNPEKLENAAGNPVACKSPDFLCRFARRSAWLLLSLCLTSALPRVVAAQVDSAGLEEIEFRVSMPTRADREAWRDPGLRLQLSFLGGQLIGLDGTPGARALGAEVVGGVRLDGDWSLLTGLRYAVAYSGIEGLHFTATMEPTWHPWEGLSLGVGLGVASIVEPTAARDDDAAEQNDTLVASYTVPDRQSLLPDCTGFGAVGVLRLGYWWVFGTNSAFGPTLRADAQSLMCEQQTGRVEPDTAEPILRRQQWINLAWSLGLGVSWR